MPSQITKEASSQTPVHLPVGVETPVIRVDGISTDSPNTRLGISFTAQLPDLAGVTQVTINLYATGGGAFRLVASTISDTNPTAGTLKPVLLQGVDVASGVLSDQGYIITATAAGADGQINQPAIEVTTGV